VAVPKFVVVILADGLALECSLGVEAEEKLIDSRSAKNLVIWH